MNAEHRLAMALREAYWTMHRQADACLQPLGVTANQFVLLSLLHDEDGITQRDLVERASSDPSTIRAMVVTLERKGLVDRKPHPRDGRAWCVRLSAKGRRTYENLWKNSESFRDRLRDIFEPGEGETLLRLLVRLSAAMSSGAEGRSPLNLASTRRV